MGETFELKTPKWRYIGEQVSHHPPVSACFSESANWEYYMDTNTVMNFRGIYLQAVPVGFQHCKLKSRGEHFVIDRPMTTVNNIMIGTMYIEHVGTMTVRNCTTGHVGKFVFSAAGWGNKGKHQVEGWAYENEEAMVAGKDKLWQLTGKWSDVLHA